MSNGYRSKKPKVGLITGLLVAILLCILCIGYGLIESTNYERHANDKRREYAEHTRNKVAETCIRVTALERAKCVHEAFEAQRDYENNQTDLVAQRQSALWAYIMGAAAVIGMVLSAVGVWLVKTTFDETRKANEIAREAMENQLRPWLVIDDMSSPSMIIANGEPNIRLKFKIKNIGASPAISIQYVCWLCTGYEPHIGYDIAWSLYRKEMLAYSGDLFPNQQAAENVQIRPETNDCKAGVGYIVIAIFYKTIWSDMLRETTQFYQMFHGVEPFIDFEYPLSSKDLKLLPWDERPGIIS